MRKVIESDIIFEAVSDHLERHLDVGDADAKLLRVEVSNGSVIRAIYERDPWNSLDHDRNEYKEIIGVIDEEVE